MTPDEMDKKIESILQMQAQFEAGVGKLTTNLARCVTTLDNLGISVADLAGVVRDSIKISDDRFTRLDDRLNKLAEAQATTDKRLNGLIAVLERHITGPDQAPQAQLWVASSAKAASHRGLSCLSLGW